MSTITIEPVSSLNFSPNNPNIGDVPSIVLSINEFGFADCVIAVDPDGERRIIAGEHRVKAARQTGIETVPVFWFENENDAVAYMLADNNIASHSIWDVPKLMDLSDTFESFDGLPFNNSQELATFALSKVPAFRATLEVSIGDFRFNVKAENWADWEDDLRREAAESSTDAVSIIKTRLGLD